MTDDIHVFAYQGYDGECYLVRAPGETTARGLLVKELGYDPTAKYKGTLDEVMDESNPNTPEDVVKLV